MDCSSGCGSSCATRTPCPCPPTGNPAIDSLEKLLSCYWHTHQQFAVEQTWYAALASRADAVQEAALALADENVDLDHVPDRIPLKILATAKQRLLEAIPEIERAADFEALFTLVAGVLKDLPGFRDELVYLTALRIGLQAGFEPRHIYLHGEARDGAALLVNLADQVRVERSQLPPIFQHPDLPTAVIQGCLAMCRHQLQWLMGIARSVQGTAS